MPTSSNSVEIAATGNLLEVRLTGKLTRDFYEQLVPAVDAQIQQFGKLRILVLMHDFHGWTAGALWEDIKFDAKHWKDIERLALVGDSKWEQGMAAFCKPFTKASVRYFDQGQLEAARAWLAED
jgi:hypothetical protein